MALIWLIIVIVSTLPVIGSLFGAWHPFFDSLADIRVLLCFIIIVLSTPLIFTKKRVHGISIIVFSLSMIFISYQNGGVAIQSPSKEYPTFKLLQTNLRFDNSTPEKLLEIIQLYQPDIITFQEASQQWRSFFAENELVAIYCVKPNDPIGAVGVIFSKDFASRFSIDEPISSECYPVSSARGYILRLSLNDKKNEPFSFDIVSTHVSWPWPFGQDRMIKELEQNWFNRKQSTNHAHSVIVAGDFNSVTWSHAVERIEKMTRTRHVANIGPTWLSFKLPDFLRPYIGLPIDQVLVSDSIAVTEVKRLRSIGSDHLPVLIEFELKKQ